MQPVDFTGKAGLGIGCGTGGITVALARDHAASSVIGIDPAGQDAG